MSCEGGDGMNDLIVQTILDELMKKSYDWEFGGKIVTIDDIKKVLCNMYNVDQYKIIIREPKS